MSPSGRSALVIDTGVFGARLTPAGRLLASRYRPLLEGRPAVTSFVTVAELQYGARLAGWEPPGLDAWIMRLAGLKSCGQVRTLPRYMQRCVPGV
jgi:hypothetical protein